MKLKLKCTWLHYDSEHKTLSCGASGDGCVKKHCPFREINNYNYLCGECWKRKGDFCPNHGECKALRHRPHFVRVKRALEKGFYKGSSLELDLGICNSTNTTN